MEGVYLCSSSERVTNLEKELEKELKYLQNEIESGGIIGKFGNADRSHTRHGYIKKTRRRPSAMPAFSALP